VAINARSSLQSIYAAVANLDGVIDVYVMENNLSIAQTIGGVSPVPHSIWVGGQ
jgi:hypothetical protein